MKICQSMLPGKKSQNTFLYTGNGYKVGDPACLGEMLSTVLKVALSTGRNFTEDMRGQCSGRKEGPKRGTQAGRHRVLMGNRVIQVGKGIVSQIGDPRLLTVIHKYVIYMGHFSCFIPVDYTRQSLFCISFRWTA